MFKNEENKVETGIRFPAESERHERTFLIWPPPQPIFRGAEYLQNVRVDLVRIAEAILPFEPITFLVSPGDYTEAKTMLPPGVEILQIPVNDLWGRDTIPAFTLTQEMDQSGNGASQEVSGVDFNFNGWGRKQIPHELDAAIGLNLLSEIGVRRRVSKVTAEGGAIETDGAGTLLLTESSIINDNRNQGMSKAEIETELKSFLGVKKIIWVKGVRGEEITDTHVDCLVRFVRPGRVIVSRPHPNGNLSDCWAQAASEALEVLKESTDARGEKFEIVPLYEPDRNKVEMRCENPAEFVSTYANFYIINGAVVMPKFGDEEADEAAAQVLRKEFPGREIVGVTISALAGGGGGIHCATHDLPYRHVAEN